MQQGWILQRSDFRAIQHILRSGGNMTHEKHLFFCRRLNDVAITDLNIELSYESWEDVLSYKDVNMSFDKFLNIWLHFFFEFSH